MLKLDNSNRIESGHQVDNYIEVKNRVDQITRLMGQYRVAPGTVYDTLHYYIAQNLKEAHSHPDLRSRLVELRQEIISKSPHEDISMVTGNAAAKLLRQKVTNAMGSIQESEKETLFSIARISSAMNDGQLYDEARDAEHQLFQTKVSSLVQRESLPKYLRDSLAHRLLHEVKKESHHKEGLNQSGRELYFKHGVTHITLEESKETLRSALERSPLTDDLKLALDLLSPLFTADEKRILSGMMRGKSAPSAHQSESSSSAPKAPAVSKSAPILRQELLGSYNQFQREKLYPNCRNACTVCCSSFVALALEKEQPIAREDIDTAVERGCAHYASLKIKEKLGVNNSELAPWKLKTVGSQGIQHNEGTANFFNRLLDENLAGVKAHSSFGAILQHHDYSYAISVKEGIWTFFDSHGKSPDEPAYAISFASQQELAAFLAQKLPKISGDPMDEMIDEISALCVGMPTGEEKRQIIRMQFSDADHSNEGRIQDGSDLKNIQNYLCDLLDHQSPNSVMISPLIPLN